MMTAEEDIEEELEQRKRLRDFFVSNIEYIKTVYDASSSSDIDDQRFISGELAELAAKLRKRMDGRKIKF